MPTKHPKQTNTEFEKTVKALLNTPPQPKSTKKHKRKEARKRQFGLKT